MIKAQDLFEMIISQLDHQDLFEEDLKQALGLFKRSSKPVVILLSGTSGTGKSSLALLLAKKMGIPTVFSTDTIRHIMRNSTTPEENPILFASTYEAGKFVKDEDHEKEVKLISDGVNPEINDEEVKARNEKNKEKKNVLKGYKMQCEIVEDTLI